MYEDHKTTITGSGDVRIDDESNEEEPEGCCIGKPTYVNLSNIECDISLINYF